MNLFQDYKGITSSTSSSCDSMFQTLLNDNRICNYIRDLKAFDRITYEHSIRVFYLAYLVGCELLYKQDKLRHLCIVAILHDIGKTQINCDLLNKKSKLTDSEFNRIKQHSVYGCYLVSSGYFTDDVVRGVAEHHERGDGSGYPFGLTHDEISSFGCIVSTCDVFDAITSTRVYREKDYLVEEAINYLRSSEMFDESVIRLIEYLNFTGLYYPIGLRKVVG